MARLSINHTTNTIINLLRENFGDNTIGIGEKEAVEAALLQVATELELEISEEDYK